MADEVLALTFQGGKRLQHTIPATAGNVAYNASPATSKRWLITRGVITLVCDATVANRYIGIVLTDGTDITEDLGATTVILASQTRALNMGELGTTNNYTLPTLYLGLTRPLLLEGADQFRITIQNGVVGDSFSGFLVMREI